MAKRVWLLAACAAMLLLVASCGGITGDSGEVGKAESALSAFANGDADALMKLMAEEAQTDAEMDRDTMVFKWAAMSAEARDAAIKNANDEMWWDSDWKAISKAADLRTNVTAAKLKFDDFRKHAKLAKDVDDGADKIGFKDRVKKMKVVGYERGFSGSNPEWGSASVAFANEYGEGLVVQLVQRAGTWFVTGATPRGFDLMNKEEFEKKKK